MKDSLFSALLCISLMYSCNTGESGVHSRIKSAVNNIRIVNTHEHFNTEADRLISDVDFFTLVSGYLQADLVSSGMSNEELAFMMDTKNPDKERWDLFNKYRNNVKTTGYSICFNKTVEGLFGVSEINENTFRVINEQMAASNLKEGWFKHVLSDKSGIDVTVVDPLGKNAQDVSVYPADFFVTVRRFDNFVRVNKNNVAAIENQYGKSVNSLSDYLNALDKAFEKAVNEDRIVAIKSGLAYSRKLYYEDVPEDKAEVLFSAFINSSRVLNSIEQKMLDDFMMHQVIGRAEKYDLPIQIHTGILSRNFNNSNPIENTNAIHLSNLFLKYRKAKFIIFHGSYPYMAELSYLAKHFPNVYIDMCWMYIISPLASKNYLEEWLLTVPSNKIMGFGGDTSVEWALGHSVMAREIITDVLVKMVEEGNCTEPDAIKIAERILRENAIEIFKLKKTGNNWGRAL